jgi:TolB-like protein
MGSDLHSPGLSVGDVFAERYVIEGHLGSGGMGAVYRAHDRALGEVVALKVLVQRGPPSRVASERFRAEVRLARRVTHTHVARVHDLGEHGGRLYFTMECVEGDTLRAALRARGRFTLAETVSVGRALASGLAEVHAHGIVHRDLKPSNVLLGPRGRVVVADFGVARDLDGDAELTVGPIGTTSYMAPEQARCDAVDARADLYALGLVLFELFTGEHALQGMSHDVSEAEREQLLRAGLVTAPAAFVELLGGCLRRDPALRPRSAEEVERALAAIPVAPEPEAPTRLTAPVPAPLEPRTSPSAGPESHSLEGAARLDRALAVLPFRYRGAKDEADDALGDVLSEELVDALSRTRGLRVLGTGVTARWRDSRDVLEMGRVLRAYAVVDGTVQRAADSLQITVRLLDAETGHQLFCERALGPLSTLSALHEQVAARIAEELRVEISTRVYAAGLPVEAMERYLAARKLLAAGGLTATHDAVDELARAAALAPGFGPAHAAHAIAVLRLFFLAHGDGRNNWERLAEDSVARALAVAPELAETHLAAGMLATHEAHFADASRHLRRAVTLAPAFAHAHEYLGGLECEAGRPEVGLRRLVRAVELDPTRIFGRLTIARQTALFGRFDEAHRHLDETERLEGELGLGVASMRARISAWSGDLARLRREAPRSGLVVGPSPRREMPSVYTRAALGELGDAELAHWSKTLLGSAESPRFSSLLLQLFTEIELLRGRPQAALPWLARAATGMLVDLSWLDHCPLLAPLRESAELVALRRHVAVRAGLLWGN